MADEGSLPIATPEATGDEEATLAATLAATQQPHVGNFACSAGDSPVRAKSLPTVAAYHHSRALGRHHRGGPKPSEVHWQRRPAVAAQVLPYDGMQHQALPSRATPHPVEGAMIRWPDQGWTVGGPQGPLDGRRHHHSFAARPKRDTGSWLPAEDSNDGEALSLALSDIKAALTHHFGSLRVAYDHMDFFKDGNLSPIEWREGVFNIFHKIKGKDAVKYRSLCEPREVYNRRMQDIFRSVDTDGNGLISFEELAGNVQQPVERPKDFTQRRKWEMEATKTPDRGASVAELLALEAARANREATEKATMQQAAVTATGSELLRIFATLMLQKYKSVEEAFAAIDVNGSGALSMAEFAEGAKERVRFAGDAKAVFKEIDVDGNGIVSLPEFTFLRALPKVDFAKVEKLRVKTRKEIVADRRQRSPIVDPPPLRRGACLASLGTQPLGEKTASSASFFSFPRSATGRLDRLLHPEELPGVDPATFSKERGPGYCRRGPEHFAETCCAEHPRRGSGWRKGAAQGRSERFGPTIPSAQGQQDRELSAAGFAAYEGYYPNDNWRISGAGAHSLAYRCLRSGKMTGMDSVNMMAPKHTGCWGDTRATLRCKSRSEPSLLMEVC